MRISPVFSDFLEKAHEMWQQDKQEDGESEDEEEVEDYLPPLPAFKITSKNKHTYLGASVFLVKEFQQEPDTSSRKRKVRDTPDDRADSKSRRGGTLSSARYYMRMNMCDSRRTRSRAC